MYPATANSTTREKRLLETSVFSGAKDFLVLVAAAAPATVELPLSVRPAKPVPVAIATPLAVVVAFSKRIWGALSPVGEAEVVFTPLDGSKVIRLEYLEPELTAGYDDVI